MGFELGKPRPANAGRKPGTPNKKTVELSEKLANLGCDPFEFMAICVSDKLPCGLCSKRKSKVPSPRCKVCLGSGYERCAPELRGKMAAELGQYLQPKRKAVEHSGELRHTVHDLSALTTEEIKLGRAIAEKLQPPASETPSTS